MWYIYNNIKTISHTTNNIAVAGAKYGGTSPSPMTMINAFGICIC